MLDHQKESIYFHIDVNNAFLSWEALYQMKEGKEDIRKIPAIIGGDISKRHGVVLAKSELAKTYGIVTGEPVVSAFKKCPILKIFSPHMSYYQECSKMLMQIFEKYAPRVEQYSIDEAFLDMTGTAKLYGDLINFAYLLKNEIKEELGFTVNIGISSNRLLAKMASDFQKPDRVHTLFQKEIQEKMWPLPIEKLFYVGKATAKRLHTLGIHTIGEIAKCDPHILVSHLKSHGEVIYQFANGIDLTLKDRSEIEQKGYGHAITIPYDIKRAEDAYHMILILCERVCERLREKQVQAMVLCIELKDNNFRVRRHQRTLLSPTNVTNECFRYACELFDELWEGEAIRLIGVSANKVTENHSRQLNLFDLDSHDKLKNLDNALDEIRNKYGSDAVKRGSFYL